MSFYRIYRPQVFDEIDNIVVRDRMFSLLTKDKSKLPHAYLFTGPKGSGKTTAARLLAKLFNCVKPGKDSAPCGSCDACVFIEQGRYMDVLELDAASNRGIDDIRSLRESIGLAPTSGTYKVYIIDEVHMLTAEAFNALLKTLEEPPAHVIFILATTDPQKVPATIKSRCVGIDFGRANTDELIHGLLRVVKKEKIDIDDDALVAVAQFADGAFRDAMKLLEQVSFQKGTITKEKVQQLLHVSAEQTITLLLHHLGEGDSSKALGMIAEYVAAGGDIRTFLTESLKECERLLVIAVTGKENGYISQQDLKDLIRQFLQAFTDMRISPIPQLPMELAVMEFCQTRPKKNIPKVSAPDPAGSDTGNPTGDDDAVAGLLSLDKLIGHWKDVIEAVKPFNNSVAGVLRSTRPKAVGHGIVTIEAFYPFHQEKLSEIKTREILGSVLKKLFGVKVKVEVVLGKK